jgi:FtsH-binding integral membrane protein
LEEVGMTVPLDPHFSQLGMAGDAGLRRFMTQVYAKLAGGLAVSSAVAWAVASQPQLRDLFFVAGPDGAYSYTALGLLLLFSPLAVLLIGGLVVKQPTAGAAGVLYWTVAALLGGSLSILALVYAEASLASTFLITAGAFAGLSVAGFVTKRNLSALVSFLTMALLGLILAMLVNLFLRSPGLYMVINGIGVLIFAGLIAADTQQLRRIYAELDDKDALEAASSYGALTLFLNFINLFQLLLSFGGRRRR